MVSKADAQQAIFFFVFLVSFSILTLSEIVEQYPVFVDYLPIFEPLTGLKEKFVLGLFCFASLFAGILIPEFKKQDRPI